MNYTNFKKGPRFFETPCSFHPHLYKSDKRMHSHPDISNRVSTVREKVREKNIFSRSGNCQGILKFVREFWNLSKSQGKVREFCNSQSINDKNFKNKGKDQF